MLSLFYKLLIFISKIFGTWLFSLVARGIATGYFVFSARRRAVGMRFYAILFPDKSCRYHAYCTWKQFQNFTYVLKDRFILRELEDIDFTFDGLSHITSALENGKGAILLMSHMGNWEVAAHLLKRTLPDMRLLLYMGIRHKEQIEKIQKENIGQDGIQIVGVNEDGGSPFDIVEGIRFLREGGAVSMTGDVVWRDSDQRTVSATMLGREVQLPETPYILSLLSGAPLIVFFAFRTGNRRYRFSALEPIPVVAPRRADRTAAIRQAAQRYADHLEKALARHPMEWYHFDDFLGAELF